eukprot:211407-Hanusia_phi.AAC.2
MARLGPQLGARVVFFYLQRPEACDMLIQELNVSNNRVVDLLSPTPARQPTRTRARAHQPANDYTITIHCIVSGAIQLSKLTKLCNGMRGGRKDTGGGQQMKDD